MQWLSWHFKDAPIEIIEGWKNFLRFSVEFFSIIPLLKTLISPWKRLADPYSGGIFNLGENIQVLITNSFSRVLGFLIRSSVIACGIIFTVLVFFGGLLVFIAWFFLPVMIIVGLFFSLMLLF